MHKSRAIQIQLEPLLSCEEAASSSSGREDVRREDASELVFQDSPPDRTIGDLKTNLTLGQLLVHVLQLSAALKEAASSRRGPKKLNSQRYHKERKV